MGRYFVRFLATGETAGWREEHDRLLRASPGESSLGFRTDVMLICTGDLAGQIALYESVSEGDLEHLSHSTICSALRTPRQATPTARART